MKSEVYRNNLKNREYGKEAPRFSPKLAGAEAVKLEKFNDAGGEKNGGCPTPPETDSSGCFGIDGWRLFLELCRKAEAAGALNELFWLLLTPEEREDVKTRVLIVQELLKGQKTQRQLAKDLKVSIAKITRGSNILKETNEKLRRLFS